MPKIKISKILLDEAKDDWRNSYINDKAILLEYLNGNKGVQNGGSLRVSGKRALGGFLSILLTVVIIFVAYIIIYGSYKKYVEKNPDYIDLNLLEVIKKSFMDFFKNIYNLFGSLVALFGVKSVEEKPTIVQKTEVYNLGKNHYTYEEATKACSVLGGRLATRAEVQAAYNSGAEWCNYGWSAGGEALYPTQEKTHRMLKRAGRDGECGVPGVNGGIMADKSMKLGVNCYGVKPTPEDDNLLNVDCSDPKVVQLLDTVTGQYGIKYTCDKDKPAADLSMSGLMANLMPHNNYTWSKDSRKNKLYIGNNSLSRNAMSYEQRLKSGTTGTSNEEQVQDVEGFGFPMMERMEGTKISSNVLSAALREIEKYLKTGIHTDVLNKLKPNKNGIYDEEKAKNHIVNIALNKIMHIFKNAGIPIKGNSTRNGVIDKAIREHKLFELKRNIDYILTPAGINRIYLTFLRNKSKK